MTSVALFFTFVRNKEESTTIEGNTEWLNSYEMNYARTVTFRPKGVQRLNENVLICGIKGSRTII